MVASASSTARGSPSGRHRLTDHQSPATSQSSQGQDGGPAASPAPSSSQSQTAPPSRPRRASSDQTRAHLVSTK